MCEPSLMGRIFFDMVVNCWLLFRLNPTAFSVACWGSIRRSVLRPIQRWLVGAVDIRQAGPAARSASNSPNSSMRSGGTSAARSVRPTPRVTIPALMRRLRSAAPAPPGSWRTRWGRLQWMAWVAKNLYDDGPTVSVQAPRALREAQRHRRVPRVRAKDRPAPPRTS